MAFYVYMLASKRNGTLYAGMTDDLIKRMWQHRNGIIDGFAKDRRVKTLVWYETHETRESALTRERQIEKWSRAWKLELIEGGNPAWHDLWDEVTKQELGSRFRGNERSVRQSLLRNNTR